MHDLVVRGATVIDGTGAGRKVADVAVDDGVISAVSNGATVGQGNREIDGEDLLLTPGWVDIHTHYDGQATWDPYLTPSSWHGVTTAVFGNCSVGFAPVKPGTEPYLINLMEGVEDIPETVLAEGIDFRWESFAEYLDVLASSPRIMDIGAQVPHAALRYYVMGARGADFAEQPTKTEIDRMGELLEASLKAGALGFTTSRTVKHRAADGRLVSSYGAEEAELTGLAQAMKRANAGVLEVNSDFGEGDFARLRAAAEIAGRPLSVLLVQVDKAPDLWRETLDQVGAACADGMAVTAQVGSRAIGVLMGLEATMHPFTSHPLWLAMAGLSPRERFNRLRDDAELRRRLVTERPDDDTVRMMETALRRTFELDGAVDYEPAPEQSIAARARAQGRDPFDLALELMMRDDGQALLLHPFENYCGGDLEVVKEMLQDPNTVCGVADAGAHVGLICDASSPTSLLTHWGRDRKRGEKLSLEFLVRKQTRDTARTYGLMDRGVIARGYKADLNLIDFQALRLLRPKLVYDLPAGGKRIIQKAEGYRHTFVSGVEVMRDGEATGELPGQLLRGAQSAPG
ncbi:MAG: amidohydrolase family protein [Rhodospirillaceae bacterium]|jgi:N-acyl-D-aspartate/D-glutamate deacylase|nr:amidohydrolase family protein [Rhodospirillaceae bacterium]MBT3492773.1 amidohydrolase family protein [Rhodospirillaceae bacterium]MBT3779532.1 amidohydrolase family protein [Rhodospirillaceae bacterium]MBT3975825.1 amidohydrolase family protein [Rhodospirillaceae bacterium]MBT4170401.1 amidohydrolase family protein [Rhodospirillaceae bacterium]